MQNCFDTDIEIPRDTVVGYIENLKNEEFELFTSRSLYITLDNYVEHGFFQLCFCNLFKP